MMFKAIALLCTAFAPGLACAQIYKWTDDNGRTVYSNVRPKAIATKNVEVVVDEEPAPSTSSREQELLERISRLERELYSRQYPPQPPAPPPPSYYPPYPSDYYASSYYPPYYAFAPGFIVAGTRFVPRSASFHSARTIRSFSRSSGRSRR